MSAVGSDTFACESCGKKHAWKPELAGRKAKCKCGHILMVPASLASEEPGLDDLLALVPSEQELKQDVPASLPVGGGACPSCGAAMGPGAVVCVGCGYNIKTGSKLATSTEAARPKAQKKSSKPAPAGQAYSGRSRARGAGVEDRSAMPATELLGPLALLAMGVGVQFYALWHGTSAPMPAVLIALVVVLALNAVVVFAGCLLAVKLVEISLGSPLSAIVKVAALAAAPAAIGMLVSKMSGVTYFGWASSLVAFFLMLKFFFDLDGGEVLLVAGIVWVTDMLAGWLVIGLVLSAIMGGPVVPSTSLVGGGNSVAEDEAALQQRQAMARSEEYRTGRIMARTPTDHEAREFMQKEKGQFRGLSQKEFDDIVAGYYQRGAVAVYVSDLKDIDGVSTASWLVVVTDLKSKKRADLFTYHNGLVARYKGMHEADDYGQQRVRFCVQEHEGEHEYLE